MQTVYSYLIIGCIFISGFLISRIFVTSGLATALVISFVKMSRGHMIYLVLLLTFSCALVSSLIPNMITILAVIPVLSIISSHFRQLEEKPGQLSTPIVVSVIYGSNIGGMASIVGSPANALFLGFLPIIERRYGTVLQGRESINFLSWLAFGVPLAAILALLAWLLIYSLLVPKSLKRADLDFSAWHEKQEPSRNLRKWGLIASFSMLAFWICVSLLQALFPQRTPWLALVSGLACLLFIAGLFLARIRGPDGTYEPFLTIRDCYSGLPARGFLIVAIAVASSALLLLLRIPGIIGTWVSGFRATRSAAPFAGTLVMALATTFSTEFLSNTVVAMNFFPVAYTVSVDLGLNPLHSMLVVSLSTTCAFMSPIATPVNALGFGSLKGVSLGKMLAAGLLMNVLSAIWISFWVLRVVPILW